MADFPDVTPLDFSSASVSTSGALLGLSSGSAAASTAWPASNRAIFVPIRVGRPLVIYKMVVGAGVTAAGNFDVGIYDAAGNKLVSSGATAKGSSTEHVLDVTDTVIGPGLFYLALAADGTNNYMSFAGLTLQTARLAGIVGMATAYTLPAVATFAALTTAFAPNVSAYVRAA